MKKVAAPYEFSQTELEMLKQLAGFRASISELAKRVGKSQPRVTTAVERLQAKGLVTTKRTGMRKVVEFSQAKHAQLLRELMLAESHIPWESLLADSQILPLLRLEGAASPPSSRTTEWRALRKLMAHGIIVNGKQGRSINPRFGKLREFIRELTNFTNLTLAASASDTAVIVWSSGSQFIIRVPAGTRIGDKRFKPTATTVLATHGVPLISNVEYYFFSPLGEELCIEDSVLHTILTDGISNITYALILMAKVGTDEEYLLATAEKLGLRSQVEGMLRFLVSHEPQPNAVLPKWNEFAEKARDYGVKV